MENLYLKDNFRQNMYVITKRCSLNLGFQVKTQLNPSSFDHWPKLYLGVNVEAEIQILNGF